MAAPAPTSPAGGATQPAKSPAPVRSVRLTKQTTDFSLRDIPRSPRPSAPSYRHSLLTVDPHRLVTEDGRPFHHDFLMLRKYSMERVKMLIAITAYNETWQDIQGTIRGVCDNLNMLAKWHQHRAQNRRTFGASEHLVETCLNLQPHEIACVVIFDGQDKMSSTMFGDTESGALLAPDVKKRMVDMVAPLAANPRPPTSDVRDCHLFEMEYIAERSRGEVYAVPLNLMFLVKRLNGGKLNSHVWFFRMLCPLLRPRYCFLLDAGTVPEPTALLRLYADMEDNRHIGGIAGEICVDRQQQSFGSLVISAQLFEYTTANFLDKAMESVFGFISVLPGAFSAYRYEAIVGRPLQTYFRLEDNDASTLSPSQSNAYLAEDRLLGFEIVAKEGCKWTLHYNHSAQAYTDVPVTIGVLTRQRRRWMNGSLFAQLLALSQWSRLITSTNHHWLRKIGFMLLFVYHAFSMALSFFIIGNAYFAYAMLFRVMQQNAEAATNGQADIVKGAFSVLMWMFQLLLAMLFVYSLGNKPEESESVWAVCVHLLGAFNAMSIGLLFWLISDFWCTWTLWTGLLGALTAIFICSILQRRFGNVVASFLHYMWMTPMFLFVLPIFSLCNTNDCSWGTRDAHAVSAQPEVKARMDRNAREFRSRIVIIWIFVNLVFSQCLKSFSEPSLQELVDSRIALKTANMTATLVILPSGNSTLITPRKCQVFGETGVRVDAMGWYVFVLACVAAFMLGIRVIGCFAYVITEWCKLLCCGSASTRHGWCRERSAQYRRGAPSVHMAVPGKDALTDSVSPSGGDVDMPLPSVVGAASTGSPVGSPGGFAVGSSHSGSGNSARTLAVQGQAHGQGVHMMTSPMLANGYAHGLRSGSGRPAHVAGSGVSRVASIGASADGSGGHALARGPSGRAAVVVSPAASLDQLAGYRSRNVGAGGLRTNSALRSGSARYAGSDGGSAATRSLSRGTDATASGSASRGGSRGPSDRSVTSSYRGQPPQLFVAVPEEGEEQEGAAAEAEGSGWSDRDDEAFAGDDDGGRAAAAAADAVDGGAATSPRAAEGSDFDTATGFGDRQHASAADDAVDADGWAQEETPPGSPIATAVKAAQAGLRGSSGNNFRRSLNHASASADAVRKPSERKRF